MFGLKRPISYVILDKLIWFENKKPYFAFIATQIQIIFNKIINKKHIFSKNKMYNSLNCLLVLCIDNGFPSNRFDLLLTQFRTGTNHDLPSKNTQGYVNES